MEPTPYLRNRRTGVILPWNQHLETHPDMVACEELPYPKEMRPPEKPTTRRYRVAQAKAVAEAKTEKAAAAKTTGKKPAKAEPETAPTAEIDDLLSGLDNG